jgi:hypothetical protein
MKQNQDGLCLVVTLVITQKAWDYEVLGRLLINDSVVLATARLI